MTENKSDVSVLRARVLNWYDENGRDLPWRAKGGQGIQKHADPYHVFLSEIMLQQTTVAHVIPYFEMFLERWPDVVALAAAQDTEVMSAWAGLGYYARARNMTKAARVVAQDFGGQFPSDEAMLRALAGFGAYTAAAMAAIAFGQASNVVDGNIERVMSRFYAAETPMPKAKPELRALAAQWVRDDRAADWPQALMDLASLVCRPKNPACGECPLMTGCAAFAQGQPETYPRKAPKTAKPVRYGVVFVIRCDDAILVERRPDKGLLGGMLGLPHLEWRAEPYTGLMEFKGLGGGVDAGAYSHVFTHFRLEQRSVAYDITDKQSVSSNRYVWIPASEITSLPTVFAKALKYCHPPPR